MSASYEFWLEDDTGNRLILIDKFFSVSFSRSMNGHGAFQMFLVYDEIAAKINPVFQVDWRISCWRSPATGMPLSLLRTYLLREKRIYLRNDGVKVIEWLGRDGVDLLSRRVVPQRADTSYANKAEGYDTMMKNIVREQMLYGVCVDKDGIQNNDRAYPSGEFLVLPPLSGVVHSSYLPNKVFNDRNVLDVLKELSAETLANNSLYGTSDPPVYFDVVEFPVAGTSRYGWAFKVFSPTRGLDRTTGSLVFSVENENMRTPTYSKSHIEEVNAVFVKNQTMTSIYTDDSRVSESKWNRLETVRFGIFDPTGGSFQTIAHSELRKGMPAELIDATFLNVPENENSPRSLYGVDWDFGDVLPVNFAGMVFDATVKIVYISVDQAGRENITGRNRVN